MVWDGKPGFYEVWYFTLTDPGTGLGAWIRLTMVAPVSGDPTCSLWFLTMDPRSREVVGRKASFPIDRLHATADPFRLEVGDAHLGDHGSAGSFEDVAWDLRWEPGRGYEHVNPFLQKAKIAKTVLVLPHADVAATGTITLPGGSTVQVDGARNGQAHLWGSKHANRWAWAHCSDFVTTEGEPAPDTFVDGVSVFVPRFGREVGPSTPVVGRFLGEDFASTKPLNVLRNQSEFALTTWRFEAVDGKRKIVGEVDAQRDLLAGVTYHDPDGDLAYCYNSCASSMRLAVFDKSGGEWHHRQTLVSDGRAHFEYAQREPIGDLTLHTT